MIGAKLDNMSSGDPVTRTRILAAARELLEEKPGAPVSMAEVARRAAVSRQALYLHFADRSDLFLEVTREADATARTPERQRRIDEATSGRAALREAVAVQAELKPELRGIATALDVLRRTDPAAQAAWTEREEARRGRCEQVIARLDAEGGLAPGWDVEAAAACLWAATSQRVWDDLLVHLGWSSERYRVHVLALLEGALLPSG